MSFKVYIPARYGASRLAGKVLMELDGLTMLEHVYRNAVASGAEAVVVATDDERVAEVAIAFGASVRMTASELPSGTDRIAAAAAAEMPDAVLVNVQGDEPFLPPAVIKQVAELVTQDAAIDIATVCEPLREQDQLDDPNVVKVVRDARDRALYFSRAAIPYVRDGADVAARDAIVRRHVGIYGYRAEFIRRFVTWPQSALERLERLEQLRALEAGSAIAVADSRADCGSGIDTPADYARAVEMLARRASR